MATTAAANILDAAQIAKSQGVTCELVHLRASFRRKASSRPPRQGCDLIVMASHGRRGIDRLLFGSQANQMLTHSKVPALIVR